jgi:choline dehydrogenase-like flavoprotein
LLIDLHQSPAAELPEADIIIVGAGAVGLSMGVELSRSGTRVLLLEAGGSWVTAESQALFASPRSIGRNLLGLHQGRYRALGGTTTFWGGQLVALEPLIFENRPWVADIAWPFSAAEVEPYYNRVFSLLGMDAQIAQDADVWKRLRVPAPENTEDLEFFFTRWTPETDFSRLFAADIRRSANLTVVINAPVTALQTDPSGRHVTHLSVHAEGRGPLTARAGMYVLANGALEVPRLMMCNLADGRPAPWSRNAWLGRGFMDHVECKCGTVTPLDERRFHNLFDNVVLDGIKYQPKIKLTGQAQVSRQLLSASANMVFNSTLSEHMNNAKIFFKAAMRGRFEWNFFKYPARLASLIRLSAPMIGRYIRDHRVYNMADRGIDLEISIEQMPVAESAVLLRQEVDALGMPLFDLDWKIGDSEIETFASLTALIDEYLQRTRLAQLHISPLLASRDPAFLAGSRDTCHHMGTTRIATSPNRGVVDANQKVHGCDNLYVSGAGVFPTCGFQNPTFTAMALGIRLADALGSQQHAAPNRAVVR